MALVTPHQLAKSGSEHGEQVALFAYCAIAKIHGFDIADEWCKTGKIAFTKSPYVNGGPFAVPALEWFHAIHNQGHGDAVRGGRAKAEGVRRGVADTFLPYPQRLHFRGCDECGAYLPSKEVLYCGLYIEMKKTDERPKTKTAKGGLSDEQIAFGLWAESNGYAWAVCYGWEHAVSVLRRYIEA